MPHPVPIPDGPLPITDTLSQRAEAMLAALVQVVRDGTTGATVNTPAATTRDPKNPSNRLPVVLETAAEQLFFRQMAIAFAAVSQPSGQVLCSNASGPLPLTRSFDSQGGLLLLFASGTCKNTGTAGTIGVQVQVDGTVKGNLKAYAAGAGQYMLLPATLILSGVSSGSHEFKFVVESDGRSSTDGNDLFNATLLEL